MQGRGSFLCPPPQDSPVWTTILLILFVWFSTYYIFFQCPAQIFFFKIFFLKELIFFLIYLFLAVLDLRAFSLVAASGGYSSLRCTGFLLRWLLLLLSTGSRPAGFSSCGLRALECRHSSVAHGLSCSVA